MIYKDQLHPQDAETINVPSIGGSSVPPQETTRKPSAILELEEEFNRSIANYRGNANFAVPKD